MQCPYWRHWRSRCGLRAQQPEGVDTAAATITAAGITHRAMVDIFQVDPVRPIRAAPTTALMADMADTNSCSLRCGAKHLQCSFSSSPAHSRPVQTHRVLLGLIPRERTQREGTTRTTDDSIRSSDT